jgi:hypothetical protein
MKYSKGICWLDDTRIPTNWEEERPPSWFNSGKSQSGEPTYGGNLKSLTTSTIGERLNTQGRFTPNLLVCDDMLNDGSVTKTKSSKGHTRKGNVIGDTRTSIAAGQFGDGAWIEGTNINDSGSSSRYYDLDKWFDKVIDNL